MPLRVDRFTLKGAAGRAATSSQKNDFAPHAKSSLLFSPQHCWGFYSKNIPARRHSLLVSPGTCGRGSSPPPIAHLSPRERFHKQDTSHEIRDTNMPRDSLLVSPGTCGRGRVRYFAPLMPAPNEIGLSRPYFAYKVSDGGGGKFSWVGFTTSPGTKAKESLS